MSKIFLPFVRTGFLAGLYDKTGLTVIISLLYLYPESNSSAGHNKICSLFLLLSIAASGVQVLIPYHFCQHTMFSTILMQEQ